MKSLHEQAAEIAELAAKATPGPWAADDSPVFGIHHIRQDPDPWDGMGYQAIGEVSPGKCVVKTLTSKHLRHNAEFIAAAPRMAALIAAMDARLREVEADAERLDAVARNYWDVRSFSMPTGAGDADVGWKIVGHYMAKPHERVIAEVYRDNPREAIDAARKVPVETQSEVAK